MHTSINEQDSCNSIANARQLAAAWREEHKKRYEHRSDGVVLIYDGSVYGWKDMLRDPGHERPGAFAVDSAGVVYEAIGGDAYNGALRWEQVSAGGAA